MSKKCVGIDIGGTTVKLGIFEESGVLVEKWEIPTRKENGGAYILGDIAESVKAKLAENGIQEEDVLGAGMGLPGPVLPDGYVEVCVNLGWRDMNPAKELSALLGGMKVASGNDANVAALGEMWLGGGKGHTNVLLITLGTGVGGGIVVDGKILTGAHGAGGEIGHIHVDDEIEECCGCGNQGCLEQFASATGIARLGRKILEESDAPSIMRGQEMSAKLVFDSVKEGDALAVQVAERFGRYLGKAVAGMTAVLDPEIIVIGGGVSKAGPVLLEYVQKYYKPCAFKSAKDTPFALAELGNDAGIYGCAKLILG